MSTLSPGLKRALDCPADAADHEDRAPTAWAARLAQAAEEMQGTQNAGATMDAVLEYAASVVPAAAVAVLRRNRRSWQPVRATDADQFPALLPDLRRPPSGGWWAHGWFRVDDFAGDGSESPWQAQLQPLGWRSALSVSLDGEEDRPATLLLWCSPLPDAFVGQVKPARLFAVHAGAALRHAVERDTLVEAIAARHRVGLAQGILMARHHLSVDESFEVLKHQSQRTNVKVRTIADQVIWTGDLSSDDGKPTRAI